MEDLQCPLCGSQGTHLITHRLCGFNDSVFNADMNYTSCSRCEYVWIRNLSPQSLIDYYSEEAVYFDSSHFSTQAPGNITKYKRYTEMVQRVALKDKPVVDAGCGRGGFIAWFENHNPEYLCLGIDLDVRSLSAAKEREDKGGPSFKEGSIYELPFPDESVGVVSYFHVLEHALDVNAVMRECQRVLVSGGHMVIEVPDGSGYDRTQPSPGFWAGVREHINHFSPKALCDSLDRVGLFVVSIEQGVAETADVDYPFLAITARKKRVGEQAVSVAVPSAGSKVSDYLLASIRNFKRRSQEIDDLPCEVIVFWGCSELVLFFAGNITQSDVLFCDISEHKQQQTILGKRIVSPESAFMEFGNRNACVVVSSVVNKKVIIDAAQRLGWDAKRIHTLVE